MRRKRLRIRTIDLEAEGNLAEAAAVVGELVAGILGADDRCCRVCGCTDLRACVVTGPDAEIRPCSWMTQDLCSACAR
jgi:hypothetical protein